AGLLPPDKAEQANPTNNNNATKNNKGRNAFMTFSYWVCNADKYSTGWFNRNTQRIAFFKQNPFHQLVLWYIRTHYANPCHPSPARRRDPSHCVESDPQTIERQIYCDMVDAHYRWRYGTRCFITHRLATARNVEVRFLQR